MSSYSESLEINDQTNNKYTSDINSLIIQLKQQVRVISTAPNLWTSTGMETEEGQSRGI